MCDFDAALLAGSLRVTVEDIGSAVSVLVKLDRSRIRELTASVREDYREHLHEEFPAQLLIQDIENVCHGAGGISFSEVKTNIEITEYLTITNLEQTEYLAYNNHEEKELRY